jgi:hypothetical protein
LARMVECPRCGETERLRGDRRDEGVEVVCEACECRWPRVPGMTCDRCGGSQVWRGSRALVERSRGTQLSVVGRVDAVLCWVCDRDELEAHERRSGGRLLFPSSLPTVSDDERPGSRGGAEA